MESSVSLGPTAFQYQRNTEYQQDKLYRRQQSKSNIVGEKLGK